MPIQPFNRQSSDLTFSAEQIAEFEKQRAHWVEVRKQADRRVDALDQILRGAAVFRADQPAERTNKDDDSAASNLMGTIFRIANESERPLAKKELKAALISAGIAGARVNGPYFYVAINRLKKDDRITVMADGRVWKDPETLRANST